MQSSRQQAASEAHVHSKLHGPEPILTGPDLAWQFFHLQLCSLCYYRRRAEAVLRLLLQEVCGQTACTAAQTAA